MKAIAAVALLGWTSLIGSAHAQSRQLMNFEEAKQRADSGDSFAQAVVALHYQLGWKTAKNPELAAKYALASANAGEPLGQFRLGSLMRAGEGVVKDEEQGLAYQSASFNGLATAEDPYSITSAAIMIFQGKVVGQGVPQDQRRKDAANLYKKAADMGYAPAQFNYAMSLKDEDILKVQQADGNFRGSAFEYADLLRASASAEYGPALRALGQDPSLRMLKVSRTSKQQDERGSKNNLTPVTQMVPREAEWVCLSPDERYAAIVTSDRVYLYEASTGRFIKSAETGVIASVTSDYALSDGAIESYPPSNGTGSAGSSTENAWAFARAFFDSGVLWISCRSRDTLPNNCNFLIRWDLKNDEFSKFDLPLSGDVVGADPSHKRIVVLKAQNRSSPSFAVVDLKTSEVTDSYEIATTPPAVLDEELFSAFFNSHGELLLVGWTTYEGWFSGLTRLIDLAGGKQRELMWKSPDGRRVIRESVTKLLSFLEIPISDVEEVTSDPAHSGVVDFSVRVGDKIFDLERSFPLGGQVGQVFAQKPNISWAWFRNGDVSKGRIREPTASFADGVSCSLDGRKILFWGVPNQNRAFNEGGTVNPGGKDWIADRPAPLTIVDVFSLTSHPVEVQGGNHVWNAKLSDDGRTVLAAISDVSPSGYSTEAEQSIRAGGQRAAAMWLQAYDVPKQRISNHRVHEAFIWPFGLYESTMYAGPGAPLDMDLHGALQQTSISFEGARLQPDFTRFAYSAETDSCFARAHDFLFNDVNGWNLRTVGPYKCSVTNVQAGVTIRWETFPPKGPNQQITKLEVERTTQGEKSEILFQEAIYSAFPIDENVVCLGFHDGLALWNHSNGDSLSEWKEPTYNLWVWDQYLGPSEQSVAVAPEGNRLFYKSSVGDIKVLNYSADGQISLLGSFLPQGHRSVLFVSHDNLYASSGTAASGVHFSDGQRTYPFEQFDLRLNRPDIVLERLGAPDEAVGIAKQLREKRLMRMGVTEDMLKPDFHVPELEIVGEVPATTDASEIDFSIRASDSKYPLERLKVFVNNVPVNGRDGELLREEGKSDAGLLGRIAGAFTESSTGPQTLERTIPIKLAAGRNKIQVSVLNNAGAESLYANAEVNCTAERPKPALYAVAMGVSEYSSSDWNLKYAAKDARDVLTRLKARAGDSYGEVKEFLLIDKEVTKESIAKIKDFLSGATIDDTVLMFVAGHGLLDSNYDYYFGTTDIDFNNPADKGIAFEEFDDLLADLPSLKKSLLIDTCHAGELDEEEKTLLASAGGVSAALPTANGVAVRSTGTRGMNVKAIEGARGASEWYDRLQGLFVDLRRGSGSTILSSSAGAEYALESSEQQNGLFTYAVLEALDGKKEADTDKDGSIEMSEVGEYVKKRVAELTNNKQTPNARRVNLEGDFTLAKTK